MVLNLGMGMRWDRERGDFSKISMKDIFVSRNFIIFGHVSQLKYCVFDGDESYFKTKGNKAPDSKSQ